ncbi:ABC transporter permease, partial [bacterium]|nr:ABC transporter permease [bacterium]
MLRNLVKTAFRNTIRNKTSSVINVLGLALGMSCSLVIFLLLKYDLSFDNFQPNKDRVFRITILGKASSEYYPGSSFPLANALRSEFPEFEQVAHISYVHSGQFTITSQGEATRYQESEGVAFVEPGFFDMFYSEWLAGNAEHALTEPNAVVLTESLAKKYFPDDNALNQVVRLDSEVDLKVAGIIKDFPSNTNFPFTALVSFKSLSGYDSNYDEQSWNRTSSSLQAYVLLKDGEKPERIEDTFPGFIEKYMGERAVRRVAFMLQPLSEIHFDTRYLDNFSGR